MMASAGVWGGGGVGLGAERELDYFPPRCISKRVCRTVRLRAAAARPLKQEGHFTHRL